MLLAVVYYIITAIIDTEIKRVILLCVINLVNFCLVCYSTTHKVCHSRSHLAVPLDGAMYTYAILSNMPYKLSNQNCILCYSRELDTLYCHINFVVYQT